MKKKILIIILATIPVIAFGQTFSEITKRIYGSFVPMFTNLLLTLAVLFFAWGVLMFIVAEGDKKDAAKDRLIWASIALFVMMSFWGLLRIVNSTFFSNDLGKGSYTVDNVYKVKAVTGTINIH